MLKFGGGPEGKRHRWIDNIMIDLGETGWGGVNCVDLVQDVDQWRPLVKAVMKLRIP
jgi:hypothetical protein